MRITGFLVLAFLSFSGLTFSQKNTTTLNQRLKVFIDCSNTWCDLTFIRTEITIVDFMLDRQAADVHVLVTEQGTGGGGSQYQMIFFGQNSFRQLTDTIHFNTEPNNTEFEKRETTLKYLKLGLTPYLMRTASVKNIKIDMKTTKEESEDEKNKTTTPTKDPWNYWVFRTGMFGYISAEESIFESSFNANFSVNRVTEELKLGMDFYGGRDKLVFKLADSAVGIIKETSRNDNYDISHYLVKSINDHWSWGYLAGLSKKTGSNNKRRTSLEAGIEYNIFPYKMVNTKYFTISYRIDVRQNIYIDSTLYDKTKEILTGHGIQSKLTFNQKWGKIELGVDYHNYFHKWKFLNLEAYLDLEIRITGGLSFNLYTYGELIRDQLYLSKVGATPQEILTRRRELLSGYRYGTHFGINYRFGSKLNNFVNPRFD